MNKKMQHLLRFSKTTMSPLVIFAMHSVVSLC